MNNKYTLFPVLFMYLIIMTFIIDVSTSLTVTTNIGETVGGGDEATIVTVLSMIKTFVGLLTFQIAGVPALVNLLLFYPPTIAFLILLVFIIKDLIPFT